MATKVPSLKTLPLGSLWGRVADFPVDFKTVQISAEEC
jgi:hypothetical protein